MENKAILRFYAVCQDLEPVPWTSSWETWEVFHQFGRTYPEVLRGSMAL